MVEPDADRRNQSDEEPPTGAALDPWAEIARLRGENEDLQLALMTTCEHGDLVEAELAAANDRLQEEIAERRRAETALRVQLDTVSQQKNDLEALIQILAEHGDLIDQQWHDKAAEIKYLTGVDPLTRIANRRRLDEYYAEAWRRMGESGKALAVILCDIDHFKLYNDCYGHLAGDDCLIRVARVLDETLDSESGLLARNGGEEFAIVLPDHDLDAAAILAERMRESVAALRIPHRNSTTAPHITISVGVACAIPTPYAQPGSLFLEADRRLYQAKHDGRDRVVHRAITNLFIPATE